MKGVKAKCKIFLGQAQWADSVSPRMNTTVSRDQYKPMRTAENLVVNYCIVRDMPVIIVFIRRAQEPTLEDNEVDLWQALPASLKNLNTFTIPCEEEFLLKAQSSRSNYANDYLYMCAYFLVSFEVCVCYFFP